MKEKDNYFGAPKAPEELINNTLNRIHEESKRRFGWKYALRSGMVVVCALVVVFVCSSWNYPKLQNPTLRNTTVIDEMKEVSLEEYETYLGVELSERLGEYHVEKVRCYMDEEENTIEADEAIYYINVKGKTAVLNVSKKGAWSLEDIQAGKRVCVNDTDIYIGRIEKTKQWMAGFQMDEIDCYLIGEDMSSRQFKKIIKNILGK